MSTILSTFLQFLFGLRPYPDKMMNVGPLFRFLISRLTSVAQARSFRIYTYQSKERKFSVHKLS